MSKKNYVYYDIWKDSLLNVKMVVTALDPVKATYTDDEVEGLRVFWAFMFDVSRVMGLGLLSAYASLQFSAFDSYYRARKVKD